MPTIFSPLSPVPGPYVELGLDTVEVGRFEIVSGERKADTDPSASFPRTALTDGSTAWKEKLSGPISISRDKAEHSNEAFDPVLRVAADHTIGAHELLALMVGAEDVAGIRRFKLFVRVPEVGLGVTNMTLLDQLPPTEPPEGSKPLLLTIDILPDGFTVSSPRATLPQIEGCPSTGPTVCRPKTQVDPAALAKARALQRAGKYEESRQEVAEVLTTYDWPGLYSKLVEVKRAHFNATVVHIRLGDRDVPLAVLAQLIDTAQYGLRKADGQDCTDDFSNSEELLAAVPCKRGGRLAPLFPDVVLLTQSTPTKKK
ncbi:hypothetical protein FIV42_10070 [Persicimonas caeni]|uniref:Uncharacterized protein n=1 Tax=Persicimonas caeni TaxID=2292766 RepID=A0A4Y6PRW7_PERCE|nr:hypothetical protein [Persicimonas caeni]QDG51066.1 hypothetical protein FIV42_10070 [Persicimonas caeni]QED32287.1 hypothetical protein FRD00_10065 [Persicimonas caeni]